MTRVEFEKFAEKSKISDWWDENLQGQSLDSRDFVAFLHKFANLCYNAGHREGMRKAREKKV